jgi:hypothetical protein
MEEINQQPGAGASAARTEEGGRAILAKLFPPSANPFIIRNRRHTNYTTTRGRRQRPRASEQQLVYTLSSRIAIARSERVLLRPSFLVRVQPIAAAPRQTARAGTSVCIYVCVYMYWCSQPGSLRAPHCLRAPPSWRPSVKGDTLHGQDRARIAPASSGPRWRRPPGIQWARSWSSSAVWPPTDRLTSAALNLPAGRQVRNRSLIVSGRALSLLSLD